MTILAWPAFSNRLQNPYNWQLYCALQANGVDVYEYNLRNILTQKYEIFHIHWPDYQLSPKSTLECLVRIFYFLTVVCFAKMKGAKIVWTIHNLLSHERHHPILEKLFWRIFLVLLDGHLSLTEFNQRLAREKYPILNQLHGDVVPLGHYRDVYPCSVSRDEARIRLGIDLDVKVLLFLGAIRPYKNVPHLIKTFRGIDRQDVILIVAGKTNDQNLENEIRIAAGEDRRVSLHLDFIPPVELQFYLKASDMMVLPYEDILNSASALLGLSFSVPVLVPDKGAMGELQQTFGEEWVRTYQGEFGREELMKALLSNPPLKNELDISRYDWSIVAAKTQEFYAELAAGSHTIKRAV